MTTLWQAIRFLHVAAMAFFVGGQMLLIVAVVPAARRHGTDALTRAVARRFGIGSAIALLTLVATGAALASHEDLWSSSTLHLKLAVAALVLVLLGLHVKAPRAKALSAATLVATLVVVWLGVRLAGG